MTTNQKNMKKNMGTYFNFNEWITNNENEIKLRMYLLDMSRRLNKKYLKNYFSQLEGESDRDYDLFIEYMSQGFNRRRKYLENKYSPHIIRNLSFKYKWIERAQEWEYDELINMINTLQFVGQDNDENSWSKQDNETNLRYFMFLAYLQLGKGCSKSLLSKILTENNVLTKTHSLNIMAYQCDWANRRDDYYNSPEYELLTSQEN